MPSQFLVQCRALMHRDVSGLVVLDLVLRFVLACVTRVTLAISIFRVNVDDLTAQSSRIDLDLVQLERLI
jgi:hypothetical protein